MIERTLKTLGYITEPDPQHRPGVMMVLTARRRVEVFRGTPAEVWTWAKKCPTCDMRGYSDAACVCGGTGERGAV